MNILNWIKPSKPVVVVNTFKTKPTKLEQLKLDKHRQLALELGKPWPPTALKGTAGREAV